MSTNDQHLSERSQELLTLFRRKYELERVGVARLPQAEAVEYRKILSRLLELL